MAFTLADMGAQSKRLAIVTGANTGLGYETSLSLVKNGLKVVMACRSVDKAKRARQSILKIVPDGNVDILQLDLSKLASVRCAADEFRDKYDRLDILINNAGIMYPDYTKTEDGFESQMATNCFGHFLFTSLLIDLMPDSDDSRITWVSSSAHKTGKINFEDLNFEKRYSKVASYGQSKLACLMYALELNRKLVTAGKKIKSNSAHPGGVHTELGRNMSPLVLTLMKYTILPFITHAVSDGIMPILEASLSPSAQAGTYYGPQGFMEMTGPSGVASIAQHALDVDVGQELWQVSEQLTGASYLI